MISQDVMEAYIPKTEIKEASVKNIQEEHPWKHENKLVIIHRCTEVSLLLPEEVLTGGQLGNI